MPQISVIIPAYNAAAFLNRCLDSLLAQSFTDWEALCIDDGSTDGTGALLEDYAAKDPRFRVVRQANAGVSAARNNALERAQGTFLLFVDSDDSLHPQTMELCLRLALRDGSDLVAFTYDRAARTRLLLRHFLHMKDPASLPFRHYVPEKTEGLVTEDLLAHATEYSRPGPGQDRRTLVKHCQPWRCLYRRDCVGDLRFIPGIIYEDFPWWGSVLLRVRKATILNLPLYYYYPNQGSYILSSRENFKIESLRTAIAAAEDLFKDAEAEKRERWEQNFLQPFRDKLAKKEKHARKDA